MTRLEIATRIFQGMCAGDWQMPILDGQTWEEAAIPRAYDLADKMLAFHATSIKLKRDKYDDIVE